MIALYVLTDPAIDRERTTRALALALAAGGTSMGVVVRDPDEDYCVQIAAMCRDAGARCFVKASLEVERRARASGVHVGAMRRADVAPVGIPFTASAHDEDEARRAKDAEAIFVGPIFDVPGKGPPRGLSLLGRVRVSAPEASLYALGGVGAEHVAACINAGASGVAVIRAVLLADKPGGAARALIEAVTKAMVDL